MKKVLAAPLVIAALVGLSGCGIFKGHGPRKTPTLGERIPILVSENGAAVDPSLSGVVVTLPPATANDAWAQPGGNAAKNMGNLALGASPTRVWSARIDGGTGSGWAPRR